MLKRQYLTTNCQICLKMPPRDPRWGGAEAEWAKVRGLWKAGLLHDPNSPRKPFKKSPKAD